MYLSKLILNPRSKEARRDLANPYDMHASLCRAFVNENEAPPRFLWRNEMLDDGLPTVLVQSEQQADWEKLESLPSFSGYFAKNVQQKPLPVHQLELDQTLKFRLRANPTVTQNGKRKGLYRPEALLGFETEDGYHPGWLERQATKSGFELVSVNLVGTEFMKFYKHKGSSPISIQSALFEGHLRINELTTFKEALAKGIGKAKALGFGLLSIAKV